MCSRRSINRRKLQRRDMYDNMRCKQCGEQESLSYILFYWNFATKIWNLFPWTTPANLTRTDSFHQHLKDSLTKMNLPPVGAISNFFPWICWGILISRNQLIFHEKHSSPKENPYNNDVKHVSVDKNELISMIIRLQDQSWMIKIKTKPKWNELNEVGMFDGELDVELYICVYVVVNIPHLSSSSSFYTHLCRFPSPLSSPPLIHSIKKINPFTCFRGNCLWYPFDLVNRARLTSIPCLTFFFAVISVDFDFDLLCTDSSGWVKIWGLTLRFEASLEGMCIRIINGPTILDGIPTLMWFSMNWNNWLIKLVLRATTMVRTH